MTFEKSKIANVSTFMDYLSSLSSPVDSFLETHILKSDFYRINLHDKEVGSFGVYDNQLLTQFYLCTADRRHGQACLNAIRKYVNIHTAFVPTCDQFFLSHVLDYDTVIINQAYFFIEANPNDKISLEKEILKFRRAIVSDVSIVMKVSGQFFENPEEDIKNGRLYLGYQQGELASIGIVERSKLWPSFASVGMYTNEAFRKRGLGTDTIRYLRRVCHQENLMPIAGCWYYNYLSKQTLEAAGMTTSTRLLKIEMSEARYNKVPS